MNLLNEPLGVENRGMQSFVRRLPPAVQVAASQAASVVAIDDTIWVQHRHNFEYEILAQQLGLIVIWVCQESETAAHHP